VSGITWPDAVTWNRRPTTAGPLVASIGPVRLNQVVEVNVGAAIHGNGSYSFAIAAPDGVTNTVGYASRESGLIGAGPSLVVVARTSTTTTPPGPPTPIATVVALVPGD
jgi:hypothetical protein